MSATVDFREILQRDGLHGALAYLNSRTRHRYTGVYRFLPPMLHNLSLFDRENPAVRALADRPLAGTYCAIIQAHGSPFRTDNSLTDRRLEGHPARPRVVAYHAVPLLDATDRCFGSLCHWDVRPRVMDVSEMALLQEIAPLVSRVVERRRSTPRTNPSAEGRVSP